MSKERPGPAELTLYVTGACDAACSFCKREGEGTENAGTMTAEFAAEVADRFPTLRSACVAGFGEPLLVKHLGEIVAALKARGLFVGLITNGTRLRRRAAEVASWGVDQVSVSLNAASPEEHRAVFGVDAWDEATGGARALLEAGVRAGASFVVKRSTVGRVPDYLRTALELGLRFAHLHNVLPHSGPRDVVFLAEVLREGTPEAERLAKFRDGWERAGAVLSADARLRNLPEEQARAAGEPEVSWPALLPPAGAPGPVACQSPFVSVGVDARGSLTGCRRIDEPTPDKGSFRDPGAWHNEHFSSLRRALTDGPLPEKCAACFGRVRG